MKKKDEPAPEMTPLEKMLQNAGPLREDGSDRFYGFENVRIPQCEVLDGRRPLQPAVPPLPTLQRSNANGNPEQFGNTWCGL